MKKVIYCALAMVMTAGCLTGCGGSSSKASSNMEDAVKTYAKAYWESDGILMMSLVPDDYKIYLKDTYYVTESQLKEKCEEYFKKDSWIQNIKYKDFSILEEHEFKDMQTLNEDLSEEYNMEMSEEAYEVSFEVTFDKKTANEHFDGETKKEREINVFEYQGKWYVYEAMGFLENAVD